MDKDLASRQEARSLALAAEAAQKQLSQMQQGQLDKIVAAIAEAFPKHALTLGQLAVEETGFGNPQDKAEKNRFASQEVYKAIRDMKTVGILSQDAQKKIWEIGVPVGVIAAIVPSTNPTSTVCYKAMIALKSGNAVVFAPHPKAVRCTLEAVRVVRQAAESAGCPAGAIGCITTPTMDATQELMHHPAVRLILATGGPVMVKSAYSSGKPAIGVGAGNGPAYIHHSADLPQAVASIMASKTFDNGTVCASEQSVIVENRLDHDFRREAARQGAYFLSKEEAEQLAKFLFRPEGALSPQVVGKPAKHLAKLAGFQVPDTVRVLIATEESPKDGWVYAREKLCPVLAYFVVPDESAALQKALSVLSHEGAGHTFSMHCKEEAVIRRFAETIPVSRILVNAPATQGGIGAATNLFPAMTLGCGAVGGSASSNNIGPMDLINVRRVAWGVKDTPKPEAACSRAPQISEAVISALAAEIMKKLL